MIESLENKRVLVTGAGGFIASHVVEEAVLAGARVQALVHYNSSSSIGLLRQLPASVLKEVEVHFGDIRDGEHMVRISQKTQIVLHLAALIGIPYSYVAPRSYVETNILGTLNFLEAARQNQFERLICTSTSETYGSALYTPIDEAHPLQGQSPYSASKIGADKMCESYYRSFQTPVGILRPFNTYGPRQSLRAVIPTIIAQAISAPEIRLGSLEPVRDFLYVKDTARAFIAAAKSDRILGHIVQIGTGTAVSVGQLVERIQFILKTSKPIVTESARIRPEQSEVMTLICQNQRAREWLGWAPRVSLDDGLTQTISWMKEHHESLGGSQYAI